MTNSPTQAQIRAITNLSRARNKVLVIPDTKEEAIITIKSLIKEMKDTAFSNFREDYPNNREYWNEAQGGW